MMYNDEKIVDDATAQKLASAYSAIMTALEVKRPFEVAETPKTTEELLGEILAEIRTLRREIAQQKRIRLEF